MQINTQVDLNSYMNPLVDPMCAVLVFIFLPARCPPKLGAMRVFFGWMWACTARPPPPPPPGSHDPASTLRTQNLLFCRLPKNPKPTFCRLPKNPKRGPPTTCKEAENPMRGSILLTHKEVENPRTPKGLCSNNLQRFTVGLLLHIPGLCTCVL